MSQLFSNEVGWGYLHFSWSCPEPSSFFPPPHYVHIKDNPLDGGPCPKRKSLLFLWMLMLVWNILPKPLQTNKWPKCCQIMCWLCIGKDLKSLSQTLQRWTLFISVSHGRLSPLQKAFPQDLQVYDDGKCTKLSPIKSFWFQKLYCRVCMMLGLCASLLIGKKNIVAGDAGEGDQW